MKNYCPIAFIIDYSDILNNCLLTFINDYNDYFTKTTVNNSVIYTYSGPKQIKWLTTIFNNYIDNELEVFRRNIENQYINDVNKLIYILSTTVTPKDNFRYSIKENDIYLDLNLFNKCWQKIFNKRFKSKSIKSGTYYIQHNELPVKFLIKILSIIYGKNLKVDEYKNKNNFLIDNSNQITVTIDKTKGHLLITEVKQLIKHLTGGDILG